MPEASRYKPLVRYPTTTLVDYFAARGYDIEAIAAAIGTTERTVHRWVQEPRYIAWPKADRYATNAWLHPSQIWPTWSDDLEGA